MKNAPVLLFFKSHIDTFTRKDGSVVQAHDDKRQAAEPKPHPNGKHKVGDQVFFPHPDKPGKNALGKYAGHRGGKSVIKHGDKEVDVEHDQVKPARGVPKQADPAATSAAAHEFRQWSKNAD